MTCQAPNRYTPCSGNADRRIARGAGASTTASSLKSSPNDQAWKGQPRGVNVAASVRAGGAGRFHVWSYAHFPLYVGIVVLGVGIQRVVMAAARYVVPRTDWGLLSAAVATIGIAMAIIVTNTASRSQHPFARSTG